MTMCLNKYFYAANMQNNINVYLMAAISYQSEPEGYEVLFLTFPETLGLSIPSSH